MADRDANGEDDGWPVSGRVVDDLLRGLFGHGRLRDRWLAECVTVAEELSATPPCRHTAGFFCLRLYGVLRDVHDSAKQGLVALEEEPSNDELEAALRDLDVVLVELRSMLSRDELLWLEYQRDSEAHPWLTFYDHKHKSRDVVVDSRNSKLMRGNVAFLEYRNAIATLTSARSIDAVAAAIAKRTLPVLRRAMAAARRCT